MAIESARRYEGAAAGRRVDSWRASGTSANAEIGPDLQKLRDRHRDLCRNNPWAARAVSAVVANTVGYGITAKFEGRTKTATSKFRDAWKAWAETTECDADGRHDIYGLQSLIDRTVEESGECIVRARWRLSSDPLTVPLQIQVLEPDYLDLSKTQQNGGNRIIQGVEFDGIGKRRAYWLFPEHPGDLVNFKAGVSAPVPAESVLHVFKQTRPGQIRGVPSGASAIITLRDLDDYEDAYLLRQKIANLFVGAVSDAENDILPNSETAPTPAFPETMEPGAWTLTPANKRVTFNTPPNAGDYGPYTRDVLLRVAAAYGITYAVLTGDLSQVNYSSGRMGWLDMQRNIAAWQWLMLIPQACDPIARWFAQACVLKGLVPDGSLKAVEWSPPRREMIDPTREIPAAIHAIRGGLTSLQQWHREQGSDTETVIREIAETNQLIDASGLVLDSDARKVSNAGLTQARPAGTALPSTDIGNEDTQTEA
jgi:lambda family phage portal protein